MALEKLEPLRALEECLRAEFDAPDRAGAADRALILHEGTSARLFLRYHAEARTAFQRAYGSLVKALDRDAAEAETAAPAVSPDEPDAPAPTPAETPAPAEMVSPSEADPGEDSTKAPVSVAAVAPDDGFDDHGCDRMSPTARRESGDPWQGSDRRRRTGHN